LCEHIVPTTSSHEIFSCEIPSHESMHAHESRVPLYAAVWNGGGGAATPIKVAAAPARSAAALLAQVRSLARQGDASAMHSDAADMPCRLAPVPAQPAPCRGATHHIDRGGCLPVAAAHVGGLSANGRFRLALRPRFSRVVAAALAALLAGGVGLCWWLCYCSPLDTLGGWGGGLATLPTLGGGRCLGRLGGGLPLLLLAV